MKHNYLVTRVIVVIVLAFVNYSCQDEGFTGGAQSDGAGNGLFFDGGGIRQPPVISSVVPNTGPVGETIVVNGSHFSGTLANNAVSFSGTPAVITEASSARLVVTVPPGATNGPITVTSDGFVTQTSTSFIVRQPNTWQFRATFPGNTRRSEVVAFAINGKGYAGTGFQSASTYRKDFWEYDPITNALTQKADYAGGVRIGAIGFAIGSKGYIGTGVNNSSDDTRDFYEYDPATNVWTSKSPVPGPARSYAGGFAAGDKGYVIGGSSGNTTYLKDIWEYHPNIDAWFNRPEFPGEARFQHIAFAIGQRGYVGAGRSSASTSSSFTDFWRFSPSASNIWTRVADMPAGSMPTVGFGCNSSGYVGMSSSNNLSRYNPSSNTWHTKPGPPHEHRGGAAFVIGSWAYVVLGGDGTNHGLTQTGAYIDRYVAEY